MGTRLRITVLGRLAVSRGVLTAAPSAPKERKLLAMLLLGHGNPVPVRQLVDELWGSSPPRTVRTALQTHVLNLRGLLARQLHIPGDRVRRELVVTGNEGYQFRVGDADFDLHEYHRLAELGESELRAGHHLGAAESLRTAESLWTGPILPDTKHGLPLQCEITRLELQRDMVQELRIESDLALGRHRELLGELTALTVARPFDERVHEYLMTALYRSGRTIQALQVFQRLRTKMAQEMGLEPSRVIQDLQRRILRATAYESIP
ncbi:BTAD domain-containing putative transcriptional regulator [Streptomyces sp. NPDC047917]|uniref:AfsR/SARP family transcriptional regulator n=1 Tax=Streptomyces sp. NPDC047917 TaxID=3365491 RepID=UPI0037152E68